MTSQQRAYLAGLIDADGSILLQFKKNSKMRFLYRIKTTIVIYQDSKYFDHLNELKKIIGGGYLSVRNDHIAELRVEGFSQVKNLLEKIKPYLRFKNGQADYMLEAVKLLKRSKVNLDTFLSVCDLAESLSAANYESSQRKHTKESIINNLKVNGIIPVTTGFSINKSK